jgi:hypothetical protein
MKDNIHRNRPQSFYASVVCRERGLDPLGGGGDTNLSLKMRAVRQNNLPAVTTS